MAKNKPNNNTAISSATKPQQPTEEIRDIFASSTEQMFTGNRLS